MTLPAPAVEPADGIRGSLRQTDADVEEGRRATRGPCRSRRCRCSSPRCDCRWRCRRTMTSKITLRAAAVVPPIRLSGESFTNTPACSRRWRGALARRGCRSRRCPGSSPRSVAAEAREGDAVRKRLMTRPRTMLPPPVIVKPIGAVGHAFAVELDERQAGVARLAGAVDDHRIGDVGQGRQRHDGPIRIRQMRSGSRPDRDDCWRPGSLRAARSGPGRGRRRSRRRWC